jgi:hypothetical protein
MSVIEVLPADVEQFAVQGRLMVLQHQEKQVVLEVLAHNYVEELGGVHITFSSC